MQVRSITGIAILVLVGLSGATVAVAQTASFKIAVVDIDKVSAQYKELASRQAELEQWVKEKRGYLDQLRNFQFVSSSEFQEVTKIVETPTAQRTPQQQKQYDELKKISGENERKFADLENNTNRTPEQSNQYSTLRDTVTAREHDLQTISQQFDQELAAKRNEAQGKLVDNVKVVIDSVAKAKGYNLVLDKTVVYFCGAPVDDITADVLKVLNGGGATASGSAKPAAGAGAGTATKPAAPATKPAAPAAKPAAPAAKPAAGGGNGGAAKP